ncbi:MAG: hypothetical protein EOL87_00360 [Spartobacteria bacterium]|nr:hypothetical protein [Spartobacteria bacterium]
MKKKYKKHGFSLVEVVVSTFIVGLSMGGIWGLLSWVTRTNYEGYYSNMAIELAERKMEEFLVLSYTNVSSGSDSINQFTRVWDVSETSNEAKRVAITINWTYPAVRTNVVVLSSIIFNEIPTYAGNGLDTIFASAVSSVPTPGATAVPGATATPEPTATSTKTNNGKGNDK